MSQRKCPECRKRYQYESVASWKPYPFCSERCKNVDLGAWLDESYSVVDDVSNDLEMMRELGEIEGE